MSNTGTSTYPMWIFFEKSYLQLSLLSHRTLLAPHKHCTPVTVHFYQDIFPFEIGLIVHNIVKQLTIYTNRAFHILDLPSCFEIIFPIFLVCLIHRYYMNRVTARTTIWIFLSSKDLSTKQLG